MTDQTGVVIALIAAVAGVSGAFLGSRIAARATKVVADATLASARADREEARRARFADGIRDLSIEALEVADADAAGVQVQWSLRDRPTAEELPQRVGGRALRVLRRLRMLVSNPTMQAAVDELEAAILDLEDLAIVTDKANGIRIAAPVVPEAESILRGPAVARYYAATAAFEIAVRVELGAGHPVD